MTLYVHTTYGILNEFLNSNPGEGPASDRKYCLEPTSSCEFLRRYLEGLEDLVSRWLST